MKACSEPSRSGSGCWHATPEPAPREKQAPRLRGECRASIQANKNRYIFWALPFSRLCKHSHGGRWTWHNGAFLDPSVVLFVVGHYTHKVFFLIRIKSFSLKVGSLVSVQDSWRSWGQIHMDLGERRASVKERNKVRKRQKGNPSVLRQFVHRGVCTLAWCPPPPRAVSESSRGATLTGSLREMHILGPHSKPTKSGLLRWNLWICILTILSVDSHVLKFKKRGSSM